MQEVRWQGPKTDQEEVDLISFLTQNSPAKFKHDVKQESLLNEVESNLRKLNIYSPDHIFRQVSIDSVVIDFAIRDIYEELYLVNCSFSYRKASPSTIIGGGKSDLRTAYFFLNQHFYVAPHLIAVYKRSGMRQFEHQNISIH